MISARSLSGLFLTCLLWGAVVPALQAQTAGQPQSAPAPAAPLVTSPVYVPPRFKFQQRAVYPTGQHQGEGWVLLTCMVDVTGKPHDVTVTRSYGGKAFEVAAAAALERSTFEPATLDGKPVEGRFTRRLTFYANPERTRHSSTGASLADVHRGASSEFTAAYASFQKALKASDRAGADHALTQMQVNNNYESATYGLAMYQYAVLWGDQRQQLEAIRRAVASDNEAQDFTYSERSYPGHLDVTYHNVFDHYLPVDVWKTGLLTCLDLELKLHEYSEALETWQRLQKVDIKPEILEKLKPVMAQMIALRTDNSAFDVTGELTDNGWSLDLFKSHFRIVTSGHIDQVRLRCQRGFLSFQFDPDEEYTVNGNYGTCQIQLTGAPGTPFTLTQF